MKIEIGKINFFIPNILVVLLAAFIVRIFLTPFGTHGIDQGTFIAWSNNLSTNGLGQFYLGWSDYLPGYLYFLWFLGKVQSFLPVVMLYKIPAILADLATGYLIYKVVGKFKPEKWGVVASLLYLFNPAIWGNSALWGQMDSFVALFVVLTIYLLEGKFVLSAIALAVGTLIKPQVPFILPVLLVMMFAKKWSFKKVLIYGSISLITFVLAFLPFVTQGQGLISFVIERIRLSFSQYPYGSVNAFNFLGLWGFWQKNPPFWIPQIVGYLMVGLAFFYYVFKKIKKGIDPYLLSAIILAGTFLFLPRMHERHLLPALAPLIIALVANTNLIVVYLGLSVTYVLNLLFSYYWMAENFVYIIPVWMINVLILVNISLFIFLIADAVYPQRLFLLANIKAIFNKVRVSVKKSGKKFKENFPKIALSSKLSKGLLLGILAFALVERLAFLDSPKNEYFDEVYHAFTAKEMLHGNVAAWEWWNTPPEGFAYEWTHPPLAKLGMWFSMSIVGETAFGWRLPGAILGTVCVYLVYLLAKKLFGDEPLSLIAAAIFSLDGLVLTMSRIGMNDTYLLTFTLLTLYLFLKEKNFWAALSFGLAISSKWSAVWLIPVLGVIFLGRKLKFKVGYLWFALIPILVYLATYIPMFLTGHGLEVFWGMQKQMWWYHTGLVATHAYSSAWWSWPLLIRPVYLYTSDEIGGMVARIYNLGNPIVFWFGLVSVFISFVYAFIEKNKMLALTLFAYLAFFVSWAASPRIMFFYHYLPSIPFMCIATGYVLRKNPKLIFAYSLICLLCFIYFYPHWAGLQIPLWLDRSYYWFSSWR